MRGIAYLIAMGSIAATPAQALDLEQAWTLLQQQGPRYQAAIHERNAGEEHRAIGRAGLLPSVSLSAYHNENRGTLKQPDISGQLVSSDLDYSSRAATLQLRQPLFNKQKMAEFRQGDHRADQSGAVFDARHQEAAVQLAERYFDLLLAHETIGLAEAKLKAFQQQHDEAQRRFELGDGTVIDVDQAIARQDLAEAELIEAQDRMMVAQQLLQELLGEPLQQVAILNDDFPTTGLQPVALDVWLDKVLSANPVILSRRLESAVANEEINLARGGHWPTLDLVMGYTANESDSVTSREQRQEYGWLGVEFRMQLYSGGLSSAQVRQAAAGYEQSYHTLRATQEEMRTIATREFRRVQSNEARLKALEKAVLSSERAVLSSRRGFMSGTSTNLDILNAEEQVFTAKRDLLEAKVGYLLSRLRLNAVAGEVGEDDIRQLNAYLGPVTSVRS